MATCGSYAAVHGVLLAHGLAVESFLDTGNRAAFDNSGAPLMLHADFALKTRATPPWAELVLDGPRLAFARTALLARAEAMGHALTDDPGLHLLVDGVIVRPRRSGEVYGFTLPAGAGDVRLVSHHTVPAQVQPDSSDARRLGVAVTRLLLNRGELPLADCRISDGWHAAEEGWRWTTGDAALPAACGGTLKVHVAAMQRYWAAAPRDAAAA